MDALERRLQQLESLQSEEFRLIMGAFEQQKKAMQSYADTWTQIYGALRDIVQTERNETREEIRRIHERLSRLENPPAA